MPSQSGVQAIVSLKIWRGRNETSPKDFLALHEWALWAIEQLDQPGASQSSERSLEAGV